MAHGLNTAVAAAVRSKVGAAVLATVLAASSATGVAAAAANGAFGQQVKEQVQDCKAQLHTGMHGIGACVSDFAQQHGQQHREGTPGKPSDPGNSGSHGKSSDPGHSGSHGKPTGTPGNGDGHGRP